MLIDSSVNRPFLNDFLRHRVPVAMVDVTRNVEPAAVVRGTRNIDVNSRKSALLH